MALILLIQKILFRNALSAKVQLFTILAGYIKQRAEMTEI
jgi:hypothetical protein